jgi:hypothetical protein
MAKGYCQPSKKKTKRKAMATSTKVMVTTMNQKKT